MTARFNWTDECQAAFDRIKKIIADDAMLIHPDITKGFRLVTDASNVGLGAILVQLDEQGRERTICYAGRVLIDAEKNYTTGERELLAIKWAVKKFRCYLFGNKFEVYTDHKPITHAKNSKNPSDRMLKWILELEEYNITYHYRPGKLNVPADIMSRIDEPDDEPIDWYVRKKSLWQLEKELEKTKNSTNRLEASDDDEKNVLSVVEIQTDEVGKEALTNAQLLDPEIQNLLVKCHKNQKFSLQTDKDGTLFMVNQMTQSYRLVIPKCYRLHVLKACHDDLGGAHLGRAKTLNKIAQRFFWTGMTVDIKKYVTACTKCSQRKSVRKPQNPPLMALPIVTTPFDRVAVDFVGPLPQTPKGNRYILVFIDYATRWPEAFATRDMKATTVAEILIKEILCRHGAPVELLSDRGRDFLAEVVQETCKFMRTHKINTAAYHPQTNGLCERFNGTLTQIISLYVNENQQNWDDLIQMALFGYRISVQESTKRTPAELLYGRQMRLPMNFDMYAPKLEFSKRLKHEWRRAQDSVARVAEANKIRHENKNNPVKYKAGEKIRIRVEATKPGLSNKLKGVRWSDPTEIIEVRGNNVKIKKKSGEQWVAQARIKKLEQNFAF